VRTFRELLLQLHQPADMHSNVDHKGGQQLKHPEAQHQLQHTAVGLLPLLLLHPGINGSRRLWGLEGRPRTVLAVCWLQDKRAKVTGCSCNLAHKGGKLWWLQQQGIHLA